MHMKISSAKWRPFCPGGDELKLLTRDPNHGRHSSVTAHFFKVISIIVYHISHRKIVPLSIQGANETSWKCFCHNTKQGLCPVWQDLISSWWRHQMLTFSALLAICAGNSLVTGEFPAQRSATRSFDFFICAWINGCVNNREADDLGRHRAHYDVIVMKCCQFSPALRPGLPGSHGSWIPNCFNCPDPAI